MLVKVTVVSRLLESGSFPPLVLVHGRAFSMNVALFNAALDGFSMDPSAEIEFPS